MLLLQWHKHSIDMHVKLVSCFALCWKLPLWTISLELDTQSNRFRIMWHSTMILRILPFGVIEWGNIRHIGSQETFNSTRSPPPAEISVQHIAATITQFLPRFKAWNWVCASWTRHRTRQYRNFDTPTKLSATLLSLLGVPRLFIPSLSNFCLTSSFYTQFLHLSTFAKVWSLCWFYTVVKKLLNGATQDQELPSEHSKFWTFLHC